jgi:hypothetical protein
MVIVSYLLWVLGAAQHRVVGFGAAITGPGRWRGSSRSEGPSCFPGERASSEAREGSPGEARRVRQF